MKSTNQLIGGVPVQGSKELDADNSIEVLNSFIRDCRKVMRANKNMKVTVNANESMSQLIFTAGKFSLSLTAQ